MCWGLADFAGGIQSRRLPVLRVVILSQAAGPATVVLLLALRGSGPPELSRLLPAAAAGVAGLIGLVAFYRALAIGTMSIVAGGMGLPVAVGIPGGDRPGAVRLIGMAAAVIGVLMVSRERHGGEAAPAAARQSVLLALVAALGFGAFALGLRSGARADVLWALAAGPLRLPGAAGAGAAGRWAHARPGLAGAGGGDRAPRCLGQWPLRPGHPSRPAQHRRRGIFALPAGHGAAGAAAASGACTALTGARDRRGVRWGR